MRQTSGSAQDGTATAADALRARPFGIWTGNLEPLTVADAQRAVAELDATGWGSLWFGEAYGREAFTAAAMFLYATGRMVVGTGIASIYARGPMAMAAAARNLAARYPGRFVLGVGVSHRPLVERDRDGKYQPPLKAITAYLERMGSAPYLAADAEMPPVVVAALGPRMLDLARDRTVGAHPYLVTPEHTAAARARLGAGDESRRRAHQHLSIYTGLPNYRNNWLRLGFDESDFVRGGSERLADALVATGDIGPVAARLRAHLDAGADHVLVQALAATLAEAPTDQWRELADALLG